MMGVNSLPKTVTRQRRSCDLNPGPAAPESSTLTTRLPSHHPRSSNSLIIIIIISCCSTGSERPHRCCHLVNNFGSSQMFPIIHNGQRNDCLSEIILSSFGCIVHILSPRESTATRYLDRERKRADIIGTVPVPWAGHFQCQNINVFFK